MDKSKLEQWLAATDFKSRHYTIQHLAAVQELSKIFFNENLNSVE
jgi:hypothetical protein